MDNLQLFGKLEQQRDVLFQKLNSTSISELYKEQCADIKSGKVFVLDNSKPFTFYINEHDCEEMTLYKLN